jgi:uncharacterized Zn ribbon protein
MKHCIYCKEEIKDEALKCNHCGSKMPKDAEGNFLKEGDLKQTVFIYQMLKETGNSIAILLLVLTGILYWFWYSGVI